MTVSTEGTRLAVLEQKVTDLNTKVDQISIDVKDIREMVQNKLNDHILMSARMADLEKLCNKLEQSQFMWRVVVPTFAAVFGSVLTFLLIEYFKSH